MFKKPTGKQYRILAVIWTLAAAAVAVSVVRRLPQVQPAYLLLLAVSLLIAVSSWKAWRAYQKNEQKSNQDSEEKDND